LKSGGTVNIEGIGRAGTASGTGCVKTRGGDKLFVAKRRYQRAAEEKFPCRSSGGRRFPAKKSVGQGKRGVQRLEAKEKSRGNPTQ